MICRYYPEITILARSPKGYINDFYWVYKTTEKSHMFKSTDEMTENMFYFVKKL